MVTTSDSWVFPWVISDFVPQIDNSKSIREGLSPETRFKIAETSIIKLKRIINVIANHLQNFLQMLHT